MTVTAFFSFFLPRTVVSSEMVVLDVVLTKLWTDQSRLNLSVRSFVIFLFIWYCCVRRRLLMNLFSCYCFRQFRLTVCFLSSGTLSVFKLKLSLIRVFATSLALFPISVLQLYFLVVLTFSKIFCSFISINIIFIYWSKINETIFRYSLL